jgi:uncharacterized iron-regulated membrane protein
MLDARTGEAVAMPAANGGFMMFMLRLHVDMLAGLPGKLLLAFMGVCSCWRSSPAPCSTRRSCAA